MPLMLLHHTSLTPPIPGGGGGTSSVLQPSSVCSSSCTKHTWLQQYTPSSISYLPKSEFLKLSRHSHFRFLHSFTVGSNDLKLLFKCASIPQHSNRSSALVIRSDHPQNADFPKYYSRKEKKPFPVPIVDLRRAARERMKKSRGQPWRPMPPPKNGLLVKKFIPVAYEVINARTLLINNLKSLLKVVTVQACRCCNEIHVGATGHPFRSCRGTAASSRHGLHDWTSATIDDILVPVDAYHLYDRLRKRISHDERFSIPRIPAVIELCIQAGVYIPEYPAKRRRKAIIRINKSEFIDADESDLPDPEPETPMMPILSEIPDSEIVPPSSPEDIISLAEETLQAWERMRSGANKLMRMYPVRVCGYCPEVHVGASGTKTQNCGAFKHQQRNGQHGWQRAVLDDLIPPRYVWHVPDINGPPMRRELRSFYGQAPAVVEMCVQAGAEAPEQFRSTMRLDIGIPASVEEAEMVV